MNFSLFRDRKKNLNCKPYLIAEIGVNHEGSLNKAIEMIDQAKRGGADAVKFQTYKADRLASTNSPSYWDITKEKCSSQYELFKRHDKFNEDDFIKLKKHCDFVNIEFSSTAFDYISLDFIDNLVTFHKISSSDITNIPFIEKIAKKRKPILISTGASTLGEIDNAVNTIRQFGVEEICIMHCILCYPTSINSANLSMINSLKRTYPNNIIGYSDHTMPSGDLISLTTAYLLGAQVLEKHFTFNKDLPGNDHYHSMDENDLKNFNKSIKQMLNLIGNEYIKKPIDEEFKSRLNARRSIVLKESVKKGQFFDQNHITFKRPGTGISPEHVNFLDGRKYCKDLDYDEILTWDSLYE